MLARSPAAQMSWRTCRLQRGRKQNSGNRKQQQNTGNQALHRWYLERTPSALSIDDKTQRGQGEVYNLVTTVVNIGAAIPSEWVPPPQTCHPERSRDAVTAQSKDPYRNSSSS